MNNSPLVQYTKISPNKTSPRNHAIDTVTIHCVVGQCTAERLGEVFAPTSRQASSNYGIGTDGKIGMYVEEKDRSWCSSNAANDNRAITIECASDNTEPYAVNDKVYASLINLLVDICKRNSIKKLVWSENKNDRVNHLNGCNMTVHRDYAAKSCPGKYLYDRHGQIAAEVNARLGVQETAPTKDPKKFIAEIAPLVQKWQEHFGFGFASAAIAQACLESGYGTSDKVYYNGTWRHNYFGLKYRPNRVDCHSGYFTANGSEQNKDGSYRPITTDWYKFACMDDCVKGYFQFIKSGNYPNALKTTTPESYLQGLKDGSYATSIDYVKKVMKVIEDYNLTQYDKTKTFLVKTKPNTPIFKAPPVQVDTIAAAGTFTIVEQSGNYGRLKSGKGWIDLRDTTS